MMPGPLAIGRGTCCLRCDFKVDVALHVIVCDKKTPEKLKIKVYKTLIRPVMIYACDTYTSTAAMNPETNRSFPRVCSSPLTSRLFSVFAPHAAFHELRQILELSAWLTDFPSISVFVGQLRSYAIRIVPQSWQPPLLRHRGLLGHYFSVTQFSAVLGLPTYKMLSTPLNFPVTLLVCCE